MKRRDLFKSLLALLAANCLASEFKPVQRSATIPVSGLQHCGIDMIRAGVTNNVILNVPDFKLCDMLPSTITELNMDGVTVLQDETKTLDY